MTLREIASISGKPGLFKVVKPTRTGIILESIDEKKKKTIANANSRVSLLEEISIYTSTGSVQLKEVFQEINKAHALKIEIDTDEASLFEFIGSVVEDYDQEKVYASDIKKLISWYNIIGEFFPEIIESKETEKSKEESEEKA